MFSIASVNIINVKMNFFLKFKKKIGPETVNINTNTFNVANIMYSI